MHALAILLYSVSLCCQILAVYIAVLLVRKTISLYKWAWVALVASLILMLGRRINPILEMQHSGTYSLLDAVLSIPISALMLIGIFGINRLMTRIQRENDFLVTLSKHDALTHALSRSEILFRVNEEVSRAKRNGHPFALLELDIDHFKVVNDRFGHGVGDQVLTKLTQLSKGMLRKIDSIGRIGGEEFLILLPETDKDQALLISERLKDHIQHSVVCTSNAQDIKITISGGVAVYNPFALDESFKNDTGAIVQDLISQADAAMYSAKNHGRNCIKTWNETMDLVH
jgi:diguanylate cyclase (GGDEF)-like protein